MRNILFILLILPAFIHAQDTPVIEQKVITEKMEKKDQKKKDAINHTKVQNSQDGKQNMKITRDGKGDAKLHYHYKHCGRNLTGIISAFNPIVGLVPAILYSSSEPLDKNLNYPSQQLMNTQGYYNKAYRKQAHRMKSRRVWVMFATGTLINLGIWSIIDNNN